MSEFGASRLAARVRSAEIEFVPRRLATPLQLSTGAICEITEARVNVTVQTSGGRIGVGRGSMFLSDLWAWPDPALSHQLRDGVLRRLCEMTARELPRLAGSELLHPLEFGLRLHQWACHDVEIAESPPSLARAMCASPFDAAVHDAVGAAVEQSAFSFYREPTRLPVADRHFPEGGAAASISRLIQKPRRELPAWWVVGKFDNLHESLEPAVKQHGYRSLKLKITGSDPHADVARTIEVFQFAKRLLGQPPTITVDSNEANPDLASVATYLELLEALDAEAFGALAYLEQPTGRDIVVDRFDWRPVTAKKPVLLDEGLTDLDILSEAQDQGWSGLALKTCKGHSMLLTAAAWAHDRGMLLSLQDLTNPGVALIHAAAVGAHLPTINGVELNSPQFTPDANEEFMPRLAELFSPRHGVHRLPAVWPAGLASRL
jgi:L-alanine-DL-glutamate epimerase-like enolase superfamily enzyme